MVPPPQRQCQVPDCDYQTPAGIPTHEQIHNDMMLHFKMAHFEMARAVEGAGAQPQAGAAAAGGVKVEKARRPTLQDGVTEADWVWFMECWRRYKAKTKLEGEDTIVSELWECCSSELGPGWSVGFDRKLYTNPILYHQTFPKTETNPILKMEFIQKPILT